MAAVDTWDPARYERFSAERSVGREEVVANVNVVLERVCGRHDRCRVGPDIAQRDIDILNLHRGKQFQPS